jgi:hypothetical protein
MSRIIEAFGYDECVRLSKYPDNCNFNLKTKEVKHENSTSTVGQFVGYVSVCEIRSAIAKYEVTVREKVLREVLDERNRQINSKGYDEHHDNVYTQNELIRAADSYVSNVIQRGWVYNENNPEKYQKEEVPEYFPFDDCFWKPENPRKDLVKAVAMLIAELERIERMSKLGD